MSIQLGSDMMIASGGEANRHDDRPLSIGWVIVAACAILYGSLIPFTIDLSAFTPANGFGLAAIGLHRSTTEDLLVNFLIYLPLGAAGVSVWGRFSTLGRAKFRSALGPPTVPRRAKRIFALPTRPFALLGFGTRPFASLRGGVVLGFCVSLTAEAIQTGIASRVASWWDVLMNTIGAGVGALAAPWMIWAGRKVISWARRRFWTEPILATATALSLGLLMYGLAPFDFVRDTAGLHAGFLRANWGLWPRWATGTLPGLVDTAAHCGWFVLIGYCLAVGRRRTGWTRATGLISSIKHCTVLAVVVQLAQMFTMSHVFELFDLWAHALGGVVGAAAGAGAWGGALSSPRELRPPPLEGAGHPLPVAPDTGTQPASGKRAVGRWSSAPLTGVAALAAVLGMDVILDSTNSFRFFSVAPAWGQVNLVPFESLWRQPTLTAVGELAAMVMAYAIIALAPVAVLRRWCGARCWLPAAVLTMLLVCLIEASQTAVHTRAADVTNPIVALMAAAMAARVAYNLTHERRRSKLSLSSAPIAQEPGQDRATGFDPTSLRPVRRLRTPGRRLSDQ